MRIGFHLPISKGFDHTLSEAQRIGCEVVQIFVKNPRSWAEKALDRQGYGGLRPAFRRSSRGRPSLLFAQHREVRRGAQKPRRFSPRSPDSPTELGISRMVVHCGSREDVSRGSKSPRGALPRCSLRSPITVLLENAAGQGRALGGTSTNWRGSSTMVGGGEKSGLLPRHGPSVRSGLRREAEIDVAGCHGRVGGALRQRKRRLFPSERLEDRPGKRSRQALAYRKGRDRVRMLPLPRERKKACPP